MTFAAMPSPAPSRKREGSQATLCAPAIDSTRTRRLAEVAIRYAPPTIIGTHSHWPMCSPVASASHTNCLSGSRKNYTVKRHRP